MTISKQEQDIILQDSINHISDISIQQLKVSDDSTLIADSIAVNKASVHPEQEITEIIDTTAVCKRNTISDITFYDSTSFIFMIESPHSDRFPFIFTEINSIYESKAREALTRELRDGKELPVQHFKGDWLIFAVMAAVFLYSLISTVSRRFFHEMRRFFLFRSVGDPVSRDMTGLFHWQSTIMNFVSFLNISLFAYCAADYYEFIPEIIPGILFWLICFVIIIAAITLRHILSYITGSVSGENDAFNEYIVTIYLSYRYIAVILFILAIMILYTSVFALKSLFLTGLFVMGVMYLIRIIRLFMIFLRKSISIFYLILYLCALEFLPVVVLMKYVTGLF